MSKELIIGLTEHRTFGNIFQAFLIEKKASFYSVDKLVKQRDITELLLDAEQTQLVKLVEQYSDEKLVQKFSRKKEAGDFFKQLDPEMFQNHISPYIDRYMNQIIRVLMNGNTRLFHKQTKYSNLYEEDLIQVSKSLTDCIFSFNRNNAGTFYRLELWYEKQLLNLLHKKIILVSSDPCSLVWQGHLYVFQSMNSKKLLPFFEKEFVFVPSKVEDKYYKTFILNAIKEHQVKATGFTVTDTINQRQAILSVEKDLKMEISLLPRFVYDEKEFLENNKANNFVILKKEQGTYYFKKISRDFQWEGQCLNLLKEWGLFENNGYYYLKGTETLDENGQVYALINWLKQNQEKLLDAGFIIRQDLMDKQYSTEKPSLSIQVKLKDDWFDVYANVTIGEFQIPFIKLRKYILNDIRELELPNGEIAVLPEEWFTDYKDLLPFAKQEGNILRIKRYHYMLVQQRLKGIDRSIFQKLNKTAEKQGKRQVALPAGLQADLRSYQHEGFSWMYHLYENQFGGCLADDMGLGKTLQTLTLLLKMKKMKASSTITFSSKDPAQTCLFFDEPVSLTENLQPASLIVMPTSLVHNWENEIKKFTPLLSVYKHTGIQRKRAGELHDVIFHYDIILTTYGIVRNDIDILREFEFLYLILDESQNIKNPASKAYQSVSQLQSRYRMVLTGTPIENSLADLWAQLNFINKGLLGNLAYFKREFITPIEKKNDQQKQDKLQLLIRPFILRRTKEQVARDLPPVTEQIRYCQMSSEQKEIYEKEKSAVRKSILENIEQQGVEKSAFVVLQGLTKLRQLANHPSLFNHSENSESGKFDEILGNLESLIAEKHKVLIFSSFVKHLELVENQIQAYGWKYSKLTGQTTHREEEIKKFQDEPETRIFLISLKAGGVGLNLTAADYVFIIDPWWNPAAENQAINRAHRIGQDKKVIVYRYITEDSIEEKIQMLQERKSSLAEKFINSNNPFKAITKEEILNLLN